MKNLRQTLRFISNGLVATLGLSLGATFLMISSGEKSTLAQSVKPSTADDYQNSEQSVNGMGPLGNSLNPVDIIHRANLSRGRNMGEFNEDTSSGLTSEADKFKRLQRERLLQQEQVQNQPQAESTKTPPQ